MSNPKKDLWCSKCGEYPDEIKDVYDWAVERRTWSNDCYELDDVDFGDCHPECAKCGSVLEYIPQIEEETDATPLPEVLGEVSGEEDIPENKTRSCDDGNGHTDVWKEQG